jgi:folate-dependent phosphoribosylglycinamide formyltransferase PurN
MTNEQVELGPRLVGRVLDPISKVLFLGYGESETSLIEALVQHNCEVWHTNEKIVSTAGYDVVISFGYRHILKKEVIGSSSASIVNLHISYLPWNRGAHPNFWSFFDSTPSGVSVHLVDEGVDTGPIICQRLVTFSQEEKTFSQTYRRLLSEIEILFKENLASIIKKTYCARPQREEGTFHRRSDLPREFGGWECEIQAEISRLHSLSATN